MTDAQALQEANRRWGAKGGINNMSLPNNENGDTIPWVEVGIVEPVIEDGHIVPEWQLLGEGGSCEEAFADADAKEWDCLP